jgi:hypothetical protein
VAVATNVGIRIGLVMMEQSPREYEYQDRDDRNGIESHLPSNFRHSVPIHRVV